MAENAYKIILFYKYVQIENAEEEKMRQFELCRRLNLKGRMIIASEGINGTFEGTDTDVVAYMTEMKADPRFADIHWKVSTGTGEAFPRLRIKVREEIVSLHLADDGEDIDPNQITGTHLKPEELRSWYEKGEEFYIVDMRNDYELKVGKFENSLFPDLENFRDLKKTINRIEHLKDKKVLTVCTGGVRCEKASGFLKTKGFEDVYQLDGGIVSYMEKYPEKDFKGSLYVFDNRKVMNFSDPENHEMIGVCDKCGVSSENYENCQMMECHRHFICCQDCLDNGKAYCNQICKLREERKKKNIIQKFFYTMLIMGKTV